MIQLKLFKLPLIPAFISLFWGNVTAQETFEYKVAKLDSPMPIDANWNKPQWEGIDSLVIDNILGSTPEYIPITYVKMQYDNQNIYVI